MNEVDSTGAAVDAGILARELHEECAPGADGRTHEHSCLNCDTSLVGSYCHACGQHAHVHRTIGSFFHDFLHGVFHFEGKIWRTLPLLAWRPGELTRRYIDGQRASFVSPMALFLFSVFLMFAVVNSVGMAPISVGSNGGFKVESPMKDGLPKLRAELATQQRARAAAVAAGQPTGVIDAQIEQSKDGIRVIGDMQTKGVGPALADAAARDQAKASNGDKTASGFHVTSNLPTVEEAWKRAQANPQLAIYQLKNAAYKFSWLLIPLSLPFMWLLFPFSRRFLLYDHTVFVTYSLGFMTLLVVVLTLFAAARLPIIAMAAAVIPPIHMYRQLKDSYDLSRFGAAWRTVTLMMFSLFALTLWGLALLTMEVIVG